MRLRFLGATGTVTGSMTLVEAEGARLLVDGGLYQGVKALRLRNWRELPVDPASLQAILLTHAHIDHSGRIPAIVRDGFEGPVICTPPTRDLCEILLPDAGRLQEEDAVYANRKGFSKHHPALPLYTEADADRAITRIAAVPFEAWQEIGPFRVRFRPAGHILGAAAIEIEHGGRRVLFSGDLGRPDDLLMREPTAPGDPDWIVIESTYGGRVHERRDPFEALAEVLRRTVARGGILLVPSFAVGRAQTLLTCFHEIFRRGLAEEVPIWMNSPMATDVTKLFRRSSAYHRLPEEHCAEVCDLARYARTPQESRDLTARRDPAVILSASGMASGGRVLHHLRALLPEARHTVLFPGFQAPGTRGDSLVRGAPTVKIHGRQIPVAAEVEQLDIFSAHADHAELLAWLGSATRLPRRVFVNHGEAVAADTVRRDIVDTFGVEACVPDHLEEFELA